MPAATTVEREPPTSRDVQAFLEAYKEPSTQAKLSSLASHARAGIETLLGDRQIKAVVQSRVKQYCSLEKKLMAMAQQDQFATWLSSHNRDIYAHEDMGDLVGVRIGLYLPSDVIQVGRLLEEKFSVIHRFGSVTGGRNPVTDKNIDIENHHNGPWLSQDDSGADEFWQHYGYKSWQVVIEWKGDGGPILGLRSSSATPKLEVQVGTVASQAWAEIQHDIIYKRHQGIAETQAMMRIIDALNGMSITTDILLGELEQIIERHERQAEHYALKPFRCPFDFQKWFDKAYWTKMSPQEQERWVWPTKFADCLIDKKLTEQQAWDICLVNSSNPALPAENRVACRALFKGLIDEFKLLQSREPPGEKLDISRVLLQMVGWDAYFDEKGLPQSAPRRDLDNRRNSLTRE